MWCILAWSSALLFWQDISFILSTQKISWSSTINLNIRTKIYNYLILVITCRSQLWVICDTFGNHTIQFRSMSGILFEVIHLAAIIDPQIEYNLAVNWGFYKVNCDIKGCHLYENCVVIVSIFFDEINGSQNYKTYFPISQMYSNKNV